MENAVENLQTDGQNKEQLLKKTEERAAEFKRGKAEADELANKYESAVEELKKDVEKLKADLQKAMRLIERKEKKEETLVHEMKTLWKKKQVTVTKLDASTKTILRNLVKLSSRATMMLAEG